MSTLFFRLFCLLLLLAVTSDARADVAITIDSLPAKADIFLKSGEVMSGLLLRRKNDGTAVLYLPDGSLKEYRMREIDRVQLTESLAEEAGTDSTESAPRRRRDDNVEATQDWTATDARFAPRISALEENKRRTTALDKWNFRADLHSLSGSNKTVGFNLTIGLHFKTLYQASPQLLVGGGIGWDLYAPSSGEETYPLYASAHFYPVAGNRQLYAFANGGYGLAFKDELLEVFEAEGGPFAHAGIGTQLFSKSGHQLGIELGYKSQNAEFSRINSNQDIEVRVLRYQRITVGVWAFIFRKKGGR